MSVLCPYCQQPAVLLRWQEPGYPYPADWGPAWKCEPCDAFIRCCQGTTRPLGTLADADTRHWRSLAHRALDVMSRDVVESVEGYAANRRVVSVVVVEVEPAGQRQASFGL